MARGRGTLAEGVAAFARKVETDFLTLQWKSGLTMTWTDGDLIVGTPSDDGGQDTITLAELRDLVALADVGPPPGHG